MYDVGSDRIAVLDGVVTPSGPAHAVDRDGEVICREERPRYQFPALDWMGESTPDEDRARACPSCTAIALERVMPVAGIDDPYPTLDVPRQPAIDWLRDPEDFSAWSIDL